MKIDIQKKVAVVTGAANGIGKVIAQQLAKEGVSLALWDIDKLGVDKLSTQINENGGEALGIECNVSLEIDVSRAIGITIDKYETIDILVANAGIALFGKVTEMDLSCWDEVFAVNTRGVFLCAKGISPIMKKNRTGRIIIASSFAAIIPSVNSAAYAGSKAALVSLTRVLAAELGPWNITVNAYAAGMIPTAMSDIDSLSIDRQNEMLDTLAIREWGRSEDIASLIIFLASDQARYITGSLIDASGGKFSVQFAKLARE